MVDDSVSSSETHYEAIPCGRRSYGVVLVDENGRVVSTLPVKGKTRMKALSAASKFLHPPKPVEVPASAQGKSSDGR